MFFNFSNWMTYNFHALWLSITFKFHDCMIKHVPILIWLWAILIKSIFLKLIKKMIRKSIQFQMYISDVEKPFCDKMYFLWRYFFVFFSDQFLLIDLNKFFILNMVELSFIRYVEYLKLQNNVLTQILNLSIWLWCFRNDVSRNMIFHK